MYKRYLPGLKSEHLMYIFFFLSSKRHIYRHREKTFSATIDKWDLSDLPHNELKIFLKLHCYFYATAFSHQRSKVCAMYKKIKLRCFTWRDSTQNFFFSNIDTGKTLPKNWRNLSTGLKCFACIYYHLKKFLVQSVYVNQCTLISLYISHTLVWLFFILMPHENEFALK